MFEGFDFSLLDDPDFKEDSVREEIVFPLLQELGYSASGSSRIIRSKSLTHPYVHIGTRKHKVNIVPDYLLEVDDEHCWILDAKSPKENILDGKNVEQAFSYAIHPDVRAFRYALCNGRELVVFDVNRIEPQLVVEIRELGRRFEEVRRFLSPVAFTRPHVLTFKPDFGLHMLKLGSPLDSRFHFIPIGIGMIAKLEENLYTAFIEMEFGDLWLAISFDFDGKRLEELMQVLPRHKAQATKVALSRQPYSVAFKSYPSEERQGDRIILLPHTVSVGQELPEVCIDARFGNRVYSDESEDYFPLWVERFYSC